MINGVIVSDHLNAKASKSSPKKDQRIDEDRYYDLCALDVCLTSSTCGCMLACHNDSVTEHDSYDVSDLSVQFLYELH